MAIAIAGQGMALSSDYVIGVAPGISAKAAGAAVSAAVVADRALILSIITGAIALTLAYLSMRRHIVPANGALLDRWQARATGVDTAMEATGTFDKAEIARGTQHPEPLATDANIEQSLAMVGQAPRQVVEVLRGAHAGGLYLRGVPDGAAATPSIGRMLQISGRGSGAGWAAWPRC